MDKKRKKEIRLKQGWKTFKQEKNNPIKVTKDMIKSNQIFPNPKNPIIK